MVRFRIASFGSRLICVSRASCYLLASLASVEIKISIVDYELRNTKHEHESRKFDRFLLPPPILPFVDYVFIPHFLSSFLTNQRNKTCDNQPNPTQPNPTNWSINQYNRTLHNIMSVVGLDFGNQNAVIAAAGRGGVDVILNGNSNRLNA